MSLDPSNKYHTIYSKDIFEDISNMESNAGFYRGFLEPDEDFTYASLVIGISGILSLSRINEEFAVYTLNLNIYNLSIDSSFILDFDLGYESNLNLLNSFLCRIEDLAYNTTQHHRQYRNKTNETT